MEESAIASPGVDLLIGGLIVGAIAIKHLLSRIHVPPLVGFILIGVALGGAHQAWGILTPDARAVFSFLGGVGVIFLLFRVGLESDLHGLTQKFPKALPIWIGNVGVSGALGYAAARHLLDLGVVPSLVAAVALTATSAAIAAEVWREAGRLRSGDGELLLDVVELDDFSGVLLMGILLAMIAELVQGNGDPIHAVVTGAFLWSILKAILLGAICVGVAWTAPRLMDRVLARRERVEPMLVVVGVALIVASLSGLLGFSTGLGAFFAGLIFCRVPRVVKNETIFLPLYGFFAPFFFIDIGLRLDIGVLGEAIAPAAILFAAAVAGKLAGAYLPARRDLPPGRALVFAGSLVPRAEIALVIMLQAQTLGDWIVPTQLFAAMILVVFVTCLFSPFAIRVGLARWHAPDSHRR